MWHSNETAAAPDSFNAQAMLARILDEVDYGIVLLDEDGTVWHQNRRARQMLDGDAALRIVGGRLGIQDPRDAALLHDALHAAARGLRRLLSVGRGDARQLASLVPVQAGRAALLLGRRQVCEDLTLQCYARSLALTPAETRVLAALCSGAAPQHIAEAQRVKLSTVRTQIGALRDKTGAASITELVRMVAALPPIVGVLHG